MIEGLRLSLKNRPGNMSFTSKYLSITVVAIQKKSFTMDTDLMHIEAAL